LKWLRRGIRLNDCFGSRYIQRNVLR
jgi:hypothetical protein